MGESHVQALTLRRLRVQVVECQRNLMKEKEYYRRYRVCKVHASQPLVHTCGQDRRYCQQCSVFHAVHEFDGAKRCAHLDS